MIGRVCLGLTITASLVFPGAAPAAAAGVDPAPRLVKDIDTTSGSSGPREMADVGGTLLLKARTPEYGWELWRSDGTEEGTEIVKDIRPGVEGSDHYGSHAVGELLFFVADDGVHGRELWRSDGTGEGTSMVEDIRAGSASSGVARLTSIGELLFFVADDGVHGRELWRSDGTEAGTEIVEDVGPGAVEELTSIGQRVYFSAGDGVHGREPWTSDGTAAGTFLLADVNPGRDSSDVWDFIDFGAYRARPYEFTDTGDAVYFTADDGSGKDLWQSDGTTAGTVRVDDGVLPSGRGIESLIGFEGGVHFINDGEWWRHDAVNGTSSMGAAIPSPAGLEMLGDFPTPGFVVAPRVEIGKTLLFSGTSGESLTGRELWRSDGTAAGTQLVSDINPNQADSLPRQFLADGAGGALFTAADKEHGRELWRSDGTPAGTAMVADIAPGSAAGLDHAFGLVRSGGRSFFAADDLTNGIELWTIDDPPPQPVEPEPDPVDPDPVEPDPVEPDPVEPDPVEPDPVEPGDPGEPDPRDADPASPDPAFGQPAAPVGDLMSGSRPARRRGRGRLVVGGSATAGRRLRLSVRCVHSAPCAGTIIVRADRGFDRRRAGRLLAAGRYVVRAGARTTIALALSEKGHALIARRRSLQARVYGSRVGTRAIRIVKASRTDSPR